MTVYIPGPEELDDALSRGYERERIAAADVVLLQIEAVGKLLRTHRLADEDEFNMLSDVESNVRATRDRLQEAVDIAMGLRDARAPRRPSPETLARLTGRSGA